METPAARPLSPSFTSPGAPTPPTEGWAVPAGHGAAWWGSAWRLFTASPGIWLAITIIYIAIMMGLSLVWPLGQIGVSLLHPVFIGGLILGCRELDRGGALAVQHLFAGFGDKLAPLIIAALLYFAGWLVIGCVALGLVFVMVGSSILVLAVPDAAVVADLMMGGEGTASDELTESQRPSRDTETP